MPDRTRELELGGGEHTELVLAILGMLAAANRLEHLLGDEDEGAALDPDDPVVLAALGLVSLRRTLLRWVDLAAADPPAQGDAAPPVSPPGLWR